MVAAGEDLTHLLFGCECKMQIESLVWFFYECCWFPELFSGQEPCDPRQTIKSFQWLLSYWLHYSRSTPVLWTDGLRCHLRERCWSRVCVCVYVRLLIFVPSTFSAPHPLSICPYITSVHSALCVLGSVRFITLSSPSTYLKPVLPFHYSSASCLKRFSCEIRRIRTIRLV